MRLVTSNYRTLTILLYFQDVKQKKKNIARCSVKRISFKYCFLYNLLLYEIEKKTFRENTFRKGHVCFHMANL